MQRYCSVVSPSRFGTVKLPGRPVTCTSLKSYSGGPDSQDVHPARDVVVLLLLCLSAGACATAGRARTADYPGSSARGAEILALARTYSGTAYRSGGSGPSGFDCSGFVQYLFGQAGIALPRTAESQFEVGQHLRPKDIAAGDLVFFRTDGRRISHVGIATGDGGFIHAPNARSRVRVDRLDTPGSYWVERYAGARRVR